MIRTEMGFAVGARRIGGGERCLVIAEIGVNHNGDLDRALAMIEAAKRAGTDAVKFQAFDPERLVTEGAEKAPYQVDTTGSDGKQLEMLRSLALSDDAHRRIKERCEAEGLVYLCTPYDPGSADLLERLGVDAFKIASTDLTNLPLLRYIAAKRVPMLVSTGMGALGEVEMAVEAVRGGGADLALLQCTSEYPAPIGEVNLRAIQTMETAFRCPVGLSDHTPGVGAGAWAVAIGAAMVEKHFTTDRTLPGPDQRGSLEPAEFAQLVSEIRNVEAALGDGVKRLMPSEQANKKLMQKSLVAGRPIKAGERFSAEALDARRPATGLSPAYQERLLGRPAARDLAAGEIIDYGDVDWGEA